MAEELFVITGATGNIGKRISEILLSRKKKVRAVARSAAKLQKLAEKGAMVVAGSLDDAKAMTTAFQGAAAVFAMIPPNYTAPDFRAYQNQISEALTKAIRDSGVRYVVNLSSVGAHRPDKLGPINGLYDHEQRLNRLPDAHVLHLRPAYFMENQFMALDPIQHMGLNGSALRPDLPIPMIATADIAEVAAEALLARKFQGKSVLNLQGPRALTLQEATAFLGKAIGKPDLRYVQFSSEDTQKALIAKGMSPDVARLFVEMSQGGNDGLMKPADDHSPKTVTKTPFEDFVKVLAAAYKTTTIPVH